VHEHEPEAPPQKRSRYLDPGPDLIIKPLGFATLHRERPLPKEGSGQIDRVKAHQMSRQSIAAIIAAATAATAAAAAETQSAPSSIVGEESVRRSDTTGSPKKHRSNEEKEANKERRLLKLVGSVVVKCMSKYQKDMDHDLFKKHAKEVCFLSA
jgi:[histone H3]-lysine36 N-trimethyltransferase